MKKQTLWNIHIKPKWEPQGHFLQWWKIFTLEIWIFLQFVWWKFNNFPTQNEWMCHNLSLGLMTKARACKVANQEGNSGITSNVPRNAKVWGNEPSHSQMNSHFGNWSHNGLRIFKRRLQESKPIGLKNKLYHWKTIET
jgi:hypothetical protein